MSPSTATLTPEAATAPTMADAAALGAASVTAEDVDFVLDIRYAEGGVGLDQILRMTDDGCGSSCASACTSC